MEHVLTSEQWVYHDTDALLPCMISTTVSPPTSSFGHILRESTQREVTVNVNKGFRERSDSLLDALEVFLQACIQPASRSRNDTRLAGYEEIEHQTDLSRLFKKARAHSSTFFHAVFTPFPIVLAYIYGIKSTFEFD